VVSLVTSADNTADTIDTRSNNSRAVTHRQVNNRSTYKKNPSFSNNTVITILPNNNANADGQPNTVELVCSSKYQ
jgi:hypothetical protein